VPHPTTRILAVLELLQAQGQMSGSRLASELGVDGRTLRRYITRLEELGIPIAVEHGCLGGYSLVPGYKLPPLLFTDDEALALSVGLLAARGLGLAGAGSGLSSAQAKLERVMPVAVRRRIRAADETMALGFPYQAAGGDNSALSALTAAALARQQVHLRYESAQAVTTERDFDPYGVAYRGGHWYVAGQCHRSAGLRALRVDRIRSVRPTSATFERPAGFDVLAHVTQSIATLPRAHAVEVHIDGEPAAVRRAFFEAIGVFEPSGHGVLLRAQADDLAWFARELARCPFPFEIRTPAALRGHLREHARALLRRSAPRRPRPSTRETR
jgi:predicted DNA-binding transcriptional regulator YafY